MVDMNPWTDIVTIAERRHGVVFASDLEECGASLTQVRDWHASGRLVSYGYGAYRIGGAPSSFEARVLAAIAPVPGLTWASHHTAATLLGLGFVGRADVIEVTRPTPLSAVRSAAKVHRSTRIPSHHQTVVRGIPCLTASRTIFDLARTRPAKVLVSVMDRGLLNGSCTVGSVWRVFHDLGGRGRPGTRRMREVLDIVGTDYVAPASELEAIGMAMLQGLGFEWQVEFSDERGYIRRVDGLHRASGLVVEFDGPQHRREPQRSLDMDGDARLSSLGLSVLRLEWNDVTSDSAHALDKVRTEICSLRQLHRPAA